MGSGLQQQRITVYWHSYLEDRRSVQCPVSSLNVRDTGKVWSHPPLSSPLLTPPMDVHRFNLVELQPFAPAAPGKPRNPSLFQRMEIPVAEISFVIFICDFAYWWSFQGKRRHVCLSRPRLRWCWRGSSVYKMVLISAMRFCLQQDSGQSGALLCSHVSTLELDYQGVPGFYVSLGEGGMTSVWAITNLLLSGRNLRSPAYGDWPSWLELN